MRAPYANLLRRQPKKPNPARAERKRGSAAGRGMAATGVKSIVRVEPVVPAQAAIQPRETVELVVVAGQGDAIASRWDTPSSNITG